MRGCGSVDVDVVEGMEGEGEGRDGGMNPPG